jgi:ArsR family metal-binding transcriptional regulator
MEKLEKKVKLVYQMMQIIINFHKNSILTMKNIPQDINEGKETRQNILLYKVQVGNYIWK